MQLDSTAMPEWMSLADAALAVRRRQLDPLRLVQLCLERIDRHEHALRAWVVVDRERALGEARRKAEALGRGEPLGPLYGVPLGIKDIVDVEGLPTRFGSTATPAEPAAADAPLVARLRRAGAIILGKTVTTEFAFIDPPPTRNPWDPALAHTPGGSSSGSAVAVAVGMCLGAVGTQTAGSLIRPAAYCGVAACKPSFGRIALDGVHPLAYHLDHAGVIASGARDAEVLFRCLMELPAGSSESAEGGPAPRLGLLEDFFIAGADEAVRQATRTALAQLAVRGARIEPLQSPPGFDIVHAMHRRIMSVEAAAVHHAAYRARSETFGPKLAELIEEGLHLSAVQYAEALAHQRQFRRQIDGWFGPLDAVILPATERTAPASVDTTGSAAFQLPWSYAGVPEVCFPCALAADGMPVGLQLIARHDQDLSLLARRIGANCAVGFLERPPLLGGD